jgi:hypothetical protein
MRSIHPRFTLGDATIIAVEMTGLSAKQPVNIR